MVVPLSAAVNPSDYVILPSEASQVKKRPSFLRRKVKVILTFLWDTPGLVAVFLIAGIACSILFPPLSAPFFAFAGMTILTRVVVKVVDHYNTSALRKVKRLGSRIQGKFPYIQAIALIAAVALSCVCWIAGGIIAGGLGLFNGLLVEVTLCKRIQKMRRKESAHSVHRGRVGILQV